MDRVVEIVFFALKIFKSPFGKINKKIFFHKDNYVN